MSQAGTIVAVCSAASKGVEKHPVDQGCLQRGHGLEGDAHAGTWHRQVSLLEDEQIALMRARGLELGPGAFGENLVTRGIDLGKLEVGRRLRVGSDAVLQITQRGKDCHRHCRIHQAVGDCIMPRVGLFTRVLRSGSVRPGDRVALDADLDRIRWAVVVVADPATHAGDASSDGIVCDLLSAALGGEPIARVCVASTLERLTSQLRQLCDDALCDLVVTVGGAGLLPGDVAPDATLAVVDRVIPGIAEAMRAAEVRDSPRAMLSRALAGLRGQSIIANLAGRPGDVREQFGAISAVLPEAVRVASSKPMRFAQGEPPRPA